MVQIALVLSGSDSSTSHCDSQIYAGLTYTRDLAASLKTLYLKGNGGFRFKWGHLGSNKPAKMVFVDSSCKTADLPLRRNVPYFLALTEKDKKHLLKVKDGSFTFGDNSIDSDTVYLRIPIRENLKTNDVRTRAFLWVGTTLLIDRLKFDANCKKIYFSVYEEACNTLDPNISLELVKPICFANCYGKKCYEDDGCGGKCGCPYGKICDQRTGECVDLCGPHSNCGDGGGRCEGKCPSGSVCKRNEYGIAYCAKEGIAPHLIGLGVLAVVLVVILIILVGLTLKDFLHEC